MVAFLEKSTGSAGFHQVIDFLNRSHICYALTKKPAVSVSFIKQFWRSAEASTDDNGELDDQDGITSIPNSEIFEQLALMGYHTDSDKLTFQKGAFSPQWRFLIHNILHCLSPKKTAWEQFSSNIATAVICLATNRKFNFSRMIFEHMVSNISSPHKFLMYPRFIQICLDMQRNQLQQHSRTYPVPSLSNKVFNNMKRPTKGYSGQEVALFPTMLDVTEPSTSPSRITSSPSPSPEPSPSHSPEPSPSHSPEPSPQHSPEHTTAAPTQPSPTQPTQPSPGAEHHFPTPHDSPLHAVHSHGSDEGSLKLNELTNLVTKLSDRIGVLEDDLRKTKKTYSSAFTKLILRVKKLESQIKTGKARRKARIVHSDDEDIEDDSSKQGRKLSDAEVQEKASTETEPFIQEVTPTEVIQDQGSSEKGSAEVSTAGATKGTASEVPVVSTAEENISTAGRTVTYTRRSEEQRKRKDKGKAIMTESEPKKKSKKELEQEKLSFAEAIRLQEQMDEEQRAQIARDEEIARQWDEEERQRSTSKPSQQQKLEEDAEKKELKGGDGSSKNYKVLSEMLKDFDRQDVEELYILVKERYSASRPEGYDLMLWGDLHTLFELDEEDEIWKNQHEYNNGIAIHMLTEKKYPLSQEMISKMLKKKLEVDHESSQAFELLRIDQGVGSTSGIRACALRNFDLEVMELENTQNNALAKLPMLKLGEYEMWEIRIKQYFQIQDYALWEVIENGNSWVPIPVTASETGPSTALKMTVPSTAEEKILVKRLMFKKLVSRLAILGVVTPPEDLNVKFLRSLPSEWDTHVVVWMNKPDFDTIGLDDLYNNFKIVEQKVKRSAGANNDDKNLAFLTTSGASSTNNINTINPEVSTGTTKVNTASTEISTASFSDATIYAFLSTQPQGSQLVHEDLEKLHDDDLEEIDLKWNITLLSMRARKFYQRTGRKIIIDGSSTAGYDKSKVECFNCHKMGHFARECRAPRSKDNRNWNQDSSSKTVRIEDASEKAMCAIDGAGFVEVNAEEEIQAKHGSHGHSQDSDRITK
ncbi:putative ribonuclease H-like domain-containing protein [Tanacetum coccineum]